MKRSPTGKRRGRNYVLGNIVSLGIRSFYYHHNKGNSNCEIQHL